MRHPLLWPFVLGVFFAGLIAVGLVWTRSPVPWDAVVPAALLALYGEKRALYIPGFGALNFGEPVYFALAMQMGPAPAALVAAAMGVLGDRMQRKPLYVLVFNVGWALLTFSAVGQTALWLGYRTHGPDLGQFVIFIACVLVYLVVAASLQAVAQVFMLNLALPDTVRQQFQLMKYSSLAVLCLGGVSMVLIARQPWALLLLAFPVEVLSAHVERERLHRRLVAAQAALVDAEKRAAVGLLGAGVAHELNSPLAAILVNCHILRMPGARPDEQAQCVAIIEKAAGRAREIVSALLDYARPAPVNAPGDPGKALADCLLLLRQTLAPVLVETPAGPLPPVRMSTGELMRVLSNLLQNARYAVDETRGRIRIAAAVEPNRVVLRVADNGGGIPDEARDRIWDPFFTTKPVGSGVGLGLPLVRSLVEQAGGRIVLESSDATGSVFRVELPRADAPTA